MRFLSVCSGIEAASQAWNPLGWAACLLSEIEPFPIAVLKARHGAFDLRASRPAGGRVPLWGDFTALRVRHFRRFGVPLPDWLVGGTPCQAFSVAGARRSLADARGNLSLAFVKLAHALARTGSLRGCLWENVPGVLSTPDNAFGCFLAALVGGDAALCPPGGRSWPRAGLVAGPRARAAWRVLDAQYFGLAQRRERVFLVADFGNGPDPAQVLLEPQGLFRDPPTRGKARQKLADAAAYGIDRDCLERSGEGANGSAAARSGLGVEAELSQALRAGRPHAVAFGGNDTRGPIEVATALNAHGGPNGRQDFESETFVVAPSLTSNPYGDHEGREGLLIAAPAVAATLDASFGRLLGCAGQNANHGHSHLIAHTLRAEGFDASEDGTGRGIPLVPIAFDMRQSDVCVYGETTPLDASYPGPAVAFDLRGREGGAQFEGPHHTANIRAASGGSSRSYVAHTWAVRRLTPRECERLQGFPDDFTLVPHRGKPAADGPRYKALGNSKAVPVVRWIGARIQEALPA